MKTMNYESSKWSRDAIDDVVVDEETLAARGASGGGSSSPSSWSLLRRRSRPVFMLGRGGGEKAAAAARRRPRASSLPAVTRHRPRPRRTSPTMISATGSLAARRDMPVGVAGEGGQVERVLVEPGQTGSRAGQVLAVINRSVQAQQAAQLAAQIEVARADLRLAQNDLDRAQALVGRGFISQADLDQKRATRDAAAARVRVAQAHSSARPAPRSAGSTSARPTAGLVLARNVEAGQVVGAGSGALFRIAARRRDGAARPPAAARSRAAAGRRAGAR